MLDPLTAVYLDLVPWFHGSTSSHLSVEVDGQEKASAAGCVAGKDRERPYHLELVLRLPPRHIPRSGRDGVLWSLRWTEYPPDANRLYAGQPSSIGQAAEGAGVQLNLAGQENGSLGSGPSGRTRWSASLGDLVTMPTRLFRYSRTT